MSVDGIWQITIDADEMDPMVAPPTATLALRDSSPNPGGTMSGPYPLGDDVEVVGLTLDGDTVTWSAHMHGDGRRGQVLDFRGTLAGDEMAGDVEIGIFGSGTFRATRS